MRASSSEVVISAAGVTLDVLFSTAGSWMGMSVAVKVEMVYCCGWRGATSCCEPLSRWRRSLLVPSPTATPDCASVILGAVGLEMSATNTPFHKAAPWVLLASCT